MMQRGFTLIELIVILILVGILAAYAVPRASYDFTADSAATELMQAIRFAQQQSMDKTGTAAAGITIYSDGFSFVNVSSITSSWKLLKPNPGYTVLITPNPGTISFDGHGKPTCTGFSCTSSTQVITVQASGNSSKIYIEPYTGYVHR